MSIAELTKRIQALEQAMAMLLELLKQSCDDYATQAKPCTCKPSPEQSSTVLSKASPNANEMHSAMRAQELAKLDAELHSTSEMHSARASEAQHSHPSRQIHICSRQCEAWPACACKAAFE